MPKVLEATILKGNSPHFANTALCCQNLTSLVLLLQYPGSEVMTSIPAHFFLQWPRRQRKRLACYLPIPKYMKTGAPRVSLLPMLKSERASEWASEQASERANERDKELPESRKQVHAAAAVQKFKATKLGMCEETPASHLKSEGIERIYSSLSTIHDAHWDICTSSTVYSSRRSFCMYEEARQANQSHPPSPTST